jgi:polygalacturonase
MRSLLFSALPLLLSAHSILNYGAHPGLEENTTISFQNSKAMKSAIAAANASESGDRTVEVPKGYTFLMMPVAADFLK